MSKVSSTEDTAAHLAREVGVDVELVLPVIWARDSQLVKALMRATSRADYEALEEAYRLGRVPALDLEYGVTPEVVARVFRARDVQFVRALRLAISQVDYDALIVRFFPPDRAAGLERALSREQAKK